MRRSEKEVTDRAEIETILLNAEICRIGLCVDNKPYIVPMNFGYHDNCLYLHSAKVGKKIEMLKTNPNVCFEVEGKSEQVDGGEVACKWSMKFVSIIGNGRAMFVEDREEKKKALNVLMAQFSKREGFTYLDKQLDSVLVIVIGIMEMSCKKSGY